MGFNRFYFSVALNCFLILLASFLFFYFLNGRQQPSTALGMAILAAGFTARLIFHVNRTNRILENFLMFMKDEDPSLSYTVRYADRNFRGLHESLGKLVHEFKENRIELEVQARYLETLLGNVSTGILSFDESGEVKTMNRTAGEYLGTGPVRNIRELDEKHPGLAARMFDLQPRKHATEKLRMDGGDACLSVSSSKVRLKGDFIHIVSLNDISSQMEEQEIESWKKLIRTINHEIMNSMTPIITLTTTIRRKLCRGNRVKPAGELRTKDLKDAVQSAGIIEDRSRSLINFIERYRELTRLPPVKKGKINLGELCSKVGGLFEPEFREKGIAFKCPADGPQIIEADRQMLEQVLINLVRNSVEALGKAEDPEIVISCRRDPAKGFFLTVSDNGEGIPVEKLERVFVPFFSTRPEGSGIGLSLCRQIMRLHHGRISIESAPGKGTRVILNF